MTTISASGLGTLIFLILIGPFVYLLRYLYAEYITHRHGVNNVLKDSTDGRENLTSRAYLFALVGYSIGIGNVWRFPYVIASNGGSAALVAYLICAVLVAWPLFLFELILGQYLRLTFVKTWEAIRPRWLSFGWAQFLLLFIAQSYFSMVITYTLPYIVGSCMTPLPWADDSEGFWTNTILNSYDDINDKPPGPGPIQWRLAVALLVFWCITFFSVAFGKNILSNITYVTVTMPVVLMIILVIFSAIQPGARAGIEFYIGKFDGSELSKISTWATALGQILFSLSPGFGTAITYSSFVSSKEDVFKAGIIVCIANSAFSLIGGFAVFSIIGNLAEEEGVPVEEVATRGGMGLAFITIAHAMKFFGGAQNVMSVLFYVMLLTLGLDSSYAWTETLVISTKDYLASKGRHYSTRIITLTLCIIMFCFGLVFTTRMGGEILDTIDMFVGTIFLLAVCFTESVIMNFDLRWQRLQYALKSATWGSRRFPEGRSIFPMYMFRFDFHLTVPFGTGFLCIYQIYNVAKNPYGGYPMSLLSWGWALLAICVATIFMTIWKSDPGGLPVIEDDPRFQQVLGKDIEVESNEKDIDAECAIEITDDDEDEKLESSIDEPTVQVLPEADEKPAEEAHAYDSVKEESSEVVA